MYESCPVSVGAKLWVTCLRAQMKKGAHLDLLMRQAESPCIHNICFPLLLLSSIFFSFPPESPKGG